METKFCIFGGYLVLSCIFAFSLALFRLYALCLFAISSFRLASFCYFVFCLASFPYFIFSLICLFTWGLFVISPGVFFVFSSYGRAKKRNKRRKQNLHTIRRNNARQNDKIMKRRQAKSKSFKLRYLALRFSSFRLLVFIQLFIWRFSLFRLFAWYQPATKVPPGDSSIHAGIPLLCRNA